MTSNKIDLNLLRVFDAVMEERSVCRAGQRICLSQSAVSHALGRLRELLNDELFIRTATGMQPTARAVTMAPYLREAWRSLEAAIEPARFEPQNSTRRFVIAVSEFVAMVMVPDLIRLLRQEVPLIDLVIRPDSSIDLVQQIDVGLIDAAVGTFPGVPPRFRWDPLFTYNDVLIAKSSLELGRLSVEKLSDLSIAVVSVNGEHEAVVDGYVSERGLVRRSEMYDRAALEQALSGSKRGPRIVSLPNYLVLPALLDDVKLAAIVPRPLAKSLARIHPLSVHQLPYETDLVDVSVLRHERGGRRAAGLVVRDAETRHRNSASAAG